YLGTSLLTDDHPVGYLYENAKDPELVVRAWPWNTAVKLDPDASTGTVECQTCHEPHNNQFTKFLRVSNANAALCTFCHNKTGYAVSGHPNATTQSYTPAGGTATNVGEYSCRSCHKPHSSGGTPYILRGAEENTCYERGCHGNNTNNTDPSTPATPAARQIPDELSKVHAHPVNTFSGRHKNVSGGESPDQLGGSGAANRHAECMDCHNPHQVQPAVVKADRGALRISAALKGAWGVEPNWPTPPTTALTTNKVTFEPIVTYAKVSAPTDEYQICLKCHSNYVTLPAGARDIAQEINPLNSSYHGIVPGGTQNEAIALNPTFLLKQPWATSQRVWCSDCHGRQTTAPPNPTHTRPYGPHGSSLNGTGPGTSNTDKMLVATIVTDAANGGTPLCLVCHQESATRDGDANGRSNNSRHGRDTDERRAPEGCFSCHMWENPAAVTAGSGDIFPHGMNKRWALLGTGPTAGSTQMVQAFNGGWYTNMNYLGKRCWTTDSTGGLPSGSPCNEHTNQNY
ncbi:MAG TPA: cytochrome c3 family protein, partial [Xanthomonadales bacterium]|nr:cytochrome c3 family protein [Xanthomonadales bacterium]